MRKPKRSAPKIEELRSRFNQQWVTEIREYEVITFLMGGGVEPYEADPITTVRAAEIKGLLRYWWRAIRGGTSNGDLDKMREREAEIWGWSGDAKKGLGQSAVQLEVEVISPGIEVSNVKTHKGLVSIAHWSSPYSYVAFPLQKTNYKVWRGTRFRLRIRYPKHLKSNLQLEIEAALWAWETFGGVGARTRRGFGALKRIDDNATYPEQNQVESWVRGKLLQGHWPDGIPHLEPQMPLAITGFSEDAFQVWQRLIRCLKNFRQARHQGRQPNRPGRSQWPEPDEIRRLAGRWFKYHKPVHPVRKFPRGQMGLPIVFHFKDKGEPPDTILQGAHHDRWASRLILKPLPCRDGFVGLVAVLGGPDQPLGGWRLTQGVNRRVDAKLEPGDAHQIEPLRLLNDETDVLRAFVKFVSERNCKWK